MKSLLKKDVGKKWKALSVPKKEENKPSSKTENTNHYYCRRLKRYLRRRPLDWYLKWTASAIIVVGASIRSTMLYPFVELVVSGIGVATWLIVAILWRDRSLIMLHSSILAILLSGIINYLAGG